MTSRRLWAMLPPGRTATEYAHTAREAEQQGLEGVFSIQLGSSPWVPLGAAAVSTSRLRLATGIALAFTRSPLETATTALDLDHLTQGRFTLGLGTSVRWWHEDLYGVAYDRPVARLAEATRIIKLVLSGQARKRGRFDGEFWQLWNAGRSGRPASADVGSIRFDVPAARPLRADARAAYERRIAELFAG